MLDKITGLLRSKNEPNPVAIKDAFVEDMAQDTKPEADSRIVALESIIRNAQFELEHYNRVQTGARMELASIQKSWGSEPSEFEKLAQRHYDEATAKIDYYSTILNEAETELLGIVR